MVGSLIATGISQNSRWRVGAMSFQVTHRLGGKEGNKMCLILGKDSKDWKVHIEILQKSFKGHKIILTLEDCPRTDPNPKKRGSGIGFFLG